MVPRAGAAAAVAPTDEDAAAEAPKPTGQRVQPKSKKRAKGKKGGNPATASAGADPSGPSDRAPGPEAGDAQTPPATT